MKKRIYPKDWKEIHPGNADMSTDSYYSQLASRVLDVLEDDGIDEVLDEPAWIRDAAVRITAWFEDLCNGTGLWSVVNTVCRNRYKRLLPFFDTSVYYNGVTYSVTGINEYAFRNCSNFVKASSFSD